MLPAAALRSFHCAAFLLLNRLHDCIFQEPEWGRISLLTQQVVDALQASWLQDGKKVMLR